MDKFKKFKKTYVSHMYQHETTANKEVSYTQTFSTKSAHSYAPYIDVSVNDGPHERWWSH
jgi:hypothetical protein